LVATPDTLVPHPIGVFDSGVGGLSILRALRAKLPQEDFVYFADSGHAPYGERDDAHVIARSRSIAQHLRARHCVKALVIACNTATAAAVHVLRSEHPDLPIIGVEPALKPAVSVSRTKRIGVMATRGTLSSAKFHALLQSLHGLAEFVLQPCAGLADAIERHDTQQVAALCAMYTQKMGRFGTGPGQIDTLVLGCTHYPFALEPLCALLGHDVQFIETGEPVARHTHQLLQTRHVPLRAPLAQHSGQRSTGQLLLLSSGAIAVLEIAAKRWLP
jgi:glutamate racemase